MPDKGIIIVDKHGREYQRPKIGFTKSIENREVKNKVDSDDHPHIGGSGLQVNNRWDWEITQHES